MWSYNCNIEAFPKECGPIIAILKCFLKYVVLYSFFSNPENPGGKLTSRYARQLPTRFHIKQPRNSNNQQLTVHLNILINKPYNFNQDGCPVILETYLNFQDQRS